VAGTSAGGSVAATSVGAATVGIAPTTGIIAGVAVVGGGVALAGGGGGGGDGGSSSPQTASVTDLSGEWRGTWIDNTDGTSGEAIFSLTQTGTSVSGTVSVAGDECLTTGNVSGTVSGKDADLTITSGAETVALNAVADTSAMTLSGTWNFAPSASSCGGTTGNFSATITGGAVVHW